MLKRCLDPMVLRAVRVALLLATATDIVATVRLPTLGAVKLAGRDVIREMARKRRTARVVIVTQFESFGEGKDAVTLEQLKTELAARYPNYAGTVFYQPAESSWQTALEEVISTIEAAK
jgi:hypothetical protein